MLKLHGASISPNHNKVKLALLEKGIEFEEVFQLPSQDEVFLARSPMGKIPVMEVDGQFFAESLAMLDYLDKVFPAAPLLPADPFERAKCREMSQIIELYVSGTGAGAQLTGAALFGAPISDDAKKDAEALIARGVKAVARLAKFAPFIMGSKFTQADCVAFPKLSFVAMVTSKVLGKNMIEGIPGAAEYFKYMSDRPAVQKLLADQQKAMEMFTASVKK
jgi:glutathione S-transferase